MGTAIFNIVMGVLAILGGLSGEVVLLGTHSSTALIVIGAVIGGLGVFQLIRATKHG